MTLERTQQTLSGCVLWIQGDNGQGYGRKRLNGRRIRVHRLSWTLEHGPIPAGVCVLHHCDTPACFNVEHLFLGTRADNAADMTRKGRRRNHNIGKTHCKRGHVFDEANTYRDPDGDRVCRECKRRARRRKHAVLKILIGILFSFGCGIAERPTAPTLTHPNEILLDGLVQCNASHHGLGHLNIFFYEDRQWLTLPDGRLAFVACRAWPGADHIECDHPWTLQAARNELAFAAAHEVAHVSGIMGHGPVHALRARLGLEVCS